MSTKYNRFLLVAGIVFVGYGQNIQASLCSLPHLDSLSSESKDEVSNFSHSILENNTDKSKSSQRTSPSLSGDNKIGVLNFHEIEGDCISDLTDDDENYREPVRTVIKKSQTLDGKAMQAAVFERLNALNDGKKTPPVAQANSTSEAQEKWVNFSLRNVLDLFKKCKGSL